jgi:hypothetical protein
MRLLAGLPACASVAIDGSSRCDASASRSGPGEGLVYDGGRQHNHERIIGLIHGGGGHGQNGSTVGGNAAGITDFTGIGSMGTPFVPGTPQTALPTPP